LAVLAFEPHPQEFLRPSPTPFRLTPLRTKARLIAELGVDAFFALPFDAEMAARTAELFVRDILVGALGVGAVVVGSDFVFGKGRGGSVESLAAMGREMGFTVTPFDTVPDIGIEKISSSRIRETPDGGAPGRRRPPVGALVGDRGAGRAWRCARPHHGLSHRQHAPQSLPGARVRRLCRAGADAGE
jgi:hypothetical protein